MKAIKEIFGDGARSGGGGYSGGFDYGDDNDNIEDQNDDAIDVLLQIVKDNDNNLPSDYVEPEKSGLVDQPTVTTDIAHKNYAMSCYYGAQTGDFSSYWGFSSNTCGAWMESTIAQLELKRDSTNK